MGIYLYHYTYARDAFTDIKKDDRYKEIHVLGKHTRHIQLMIEDIDKKCKIVLGET